MYAIIVSKKDEAGMNIKENLLEEIKFERKHGSKIESYAHGNISLYVIEKDTIFYEECEDAIKAENYIFATRHQSKSKEKTLSVHFPGNFGKAEYGGKESELCFTDPVLLKKAFLNLSMFGKDSGYAITLEATHHGPLISKPVFFIEIGSTSEEWKDKEAGKIIARTIIKTLTEEKENDYEKAIGFGGSHYCAAFNKIELETNVALGHICPKYSIENLDEDIVKKMLLSANGIGYAILDWKGMDSDNRKKITEILDKLNITCKKTKDI